MRSQIRVACLLFLTALLVGPGCNTAPTGPPFKWADAPPAHRGRVYLYRSDPRTSLAVVFASIDGQEIGRFRNAEYETLEVSAGSHRLKVGMRGFGFFSLGRNEHVFRVKRGEVVFFRLQVRMDDGGQTPLDGPRELEIAGRSDQRGSENVFIAQQTRSQATPDLEVSTRVGKSN